MKRFSALLAVLIMLGICTSSYGYFLVYNMSGTIRGTMSTEDPNIKNVTISFKGYLAMDFNDANSFNDANLFIYGRDSNDHKVYVQLNASDSNAFLDSAIWYRDIKNFYELDGQPPFDCRIVIKGDVKSTEIGLAGKKEIASSLKGIITAEDGMFLEVNQHLAGVGNSISATLDTALTKTINNPSDPCTHDEVVNGLKDKLANKGYLPVSIPAP
jgi:hypothetical protein